VNNIVNIKSGRPYDLYIGRANKTFNVKQSIFFNPFIIGKDGTRKEVIEKFREYAPTNKALMNNLYLIDGQTLGCWCNWPNEDCHGSVLFELREKQKQDKVDNRLKANWDLND